MGRHVTPAERHPLIPHRAVDARQELPALELEVLERWRERDVFAASLRAREGAKQWVFYEGPPTANGPPGSHHVLSRVFKDIYPRYQTMRGYRVERKGGWDCHGLPVEIAVEQALGIKSKAEVEEYGIGEFNARCRESVFTYLEEWNRLTERIGFWLDLDDAYRTLDESYIESVWWALSQIDRRGLLYEGHKVSPYCPRCETTLSSHEVAQGYKDVVDQSLYLKLPVSSDRGSASEDRLLVWTTTPWTLPGNVAVAVSPTASYARARLGAEHFVLVSDRVAAVLGEQAEVIERFSGEELVERYGSYLSPIFKLNDRLPGGSQILADDFVTTEEGTGIVHLAPAFGEDDYRVAAAAGIFRGDEPHTLYNPVQAGRHLRRSRARPRRQLVGGSLRQGSRADERADRGPPGAGPAAARAGLRAFLPPLLALRHAVAVLRETVVVHSDDEAPRRAAGGERDGELAPSARQGGPLRGLVEEQRRLGALTRALLGNTAAGVALPGRARTRDRVVCRPAGALRHKPRRSPPSVRRRGRVPVH